jgi:hypothetical protein
MAMQHPHPHDADIPAHARDILMTQSASPPWDPLAHGARGPAFPLAFLQCYNHVWLDTNWNQSATKRANLERACTTSWFDAAQPMTWTRAHARRHDTHDACPAHTAVWIIGQLKVQQEQDPL